MYRLLEAPAWQGILTGAFAYLGHGLGSLVFGQHLLGGEALAFLCAFFGTLLIRLRLEGMIGEKGGEQGAFLMLCLPLSVFLFLPGWGPLAYLLGAGGFFLAGKRLPRREWALPSGLYGGLLAVCAVLSAAMVYCLAAGKLI